MRTKKEEGEAREENNERSGRDRQHNQKEKTRVTCEFRKKWLK
jgi:hypothetical protein